MVSRRPSTASGAIEHGIHFSREAGAPLPPLPSHPEAAIPSSGSQSRTRRAVKSVRDVAERGSSSLAQIGRDRALLDELRKKNLMRDAGFSIKNGKKHHRYSAKDNPFPISYERIILDHQVWEAMFYEQLVGGVTYLHFETPPEKVVDLGCGSGAWIINTAKVWKSTHFFGVDIVPIQPDLRYIDTDLANRITWVNANWLERLPFPDNYFDFVMVKRMCRASPEDRAGHILDEIIRILKPGCPAEFCEEDLYFPGSCKADPEDGAKSSDTTSSIKSGASNSSEGTYKRTPAPPSSSSPNSGQTTTPPAQNENIARRFHSQQDDALSSQMSDRPINERTASDIEATTSKHSLSIAHTLDIGANGPSYRNDPSQSALLALKSQSRNTSYSTSTDGIQNANDATYGTEAANGTQNTSGMAVGGPAMGYGEEQTSRRSKSIDFYHPSVSQPLNPRDHSLLERIYNEMHAARFINLAPLKIFAMSMDFAFARPSLTPPMSFVFPPRPKKRYFDEGYSDIYDPLLLTFDNSEVDRAIVQYARSTVTSGRNVNAKNRGEVVQTQNSISRADEVVSQFVIIDDARLPAVPIRRPRAHISTKSASNGSRGAAAMSPIHSVRSPLALSSDNALTEKREDLRSESPLIFSRATGSETTSDNSSPVSALVFTPAATPPPPTPSPPPPPPPPPALDSQRKPLEIDLKSLHMHLSLRVAETLGCAEAMWEWVLSEQERYAELQKRRRHRGPSYTIDEEEDLQMTAIREMSRADFDSCLSRFEMDMQDKVALDHALDKYLHIKPHPTPNRSAERRSFDAACAAWDNLHAPELGQSDSQSTNSGTGDMRYLSRTMRIITGYKPM